MASVFIIGGAGQIGLRLSKLLSDKGHAVRAMYRKSEQESAIRQQGAEPVKANLTELTAGELAEHLTGCEAVVFTAGAGGKGGKETTSAVDGQGLNKAVEAALSAGVSRFLLVSVFPEAARGGEISESFEHYMQVKKMADVELAQTSLDWVILRPGTLRNESGTGLIRAGLAIPYGEIPRDDVAATLAEIIDQPAVSRVIIELTTGDAPIRDAVQMMAAR